MSNICFIRPPSILPIETFGSNQGFAPLGTAYLTAVLKKEGHRVNVIDAFGEAINKFTRIEKTSLLINGLLADEIVDKINPDDDFISITCLFSNEWIYIKEIISQIKAKYPSKTIILGGEHITGDVDNSLVNLQFEVICVLGEGEATLADLIDKLEKGKPLSDVNGIAYMENGAVIKTPPGKRIKQIDELPLPAWEEIPLQNYFDVGFGGSTFNQRSIPMLASRGCPYKCTFCSNPNMWGVNWFPRNTDKLIDEIELYKNKYNVTHIDFFDLTTIINKKWIIDFCEKLIARNLGVTWSMPAGTRSEVLDPSLIDLLIKSGLRKMDFAPESGSVATLARVKKKVNLDKMLVSIKYTVEKDLPSGATLIFGLPGQSIFECFENVFFAVKLAWVGLYDLPCFPFVPYPGSELYFNLVKEGKVNTRGPEYDLFLARNVYTRLSKMKSWAKEIPAWSLPIFVLGTMSLFYTLQYIFRPKRFFNLVKRVIKGEPVTTMELLIHGIIINFGKGRKVNVKDSIVIEGL